MAPPYKRALFMENQLNKASPTPLYQQIKDLISLDIENGVYQQGEKIPSEKRLCERYSISRITVRHALQSLVDQGILERVQGKGTFVTKRVTTRMIHYLGFSESLLSNGLKPESKILEIKREIIKGSIANKFQANEKLDSIHITRLRSCDSYPIVLFSSYYPYRIIANYVDEISLSESIYAVLEKRAGIKPKSAIQTIQIAYATDEEATHLMIKPFSPIFLVKALVKDAKGRPFEYFKARYRVDRVEFYVELER